jgi:hypothetical protein
LGVDNRGDSFPQKRMVVNAEDFECGSDRSFTLPTLFLWLSSVRLSSTVAQAMLPSFEPFPAAAGLVPIGNMAGHGKLYFRSNGGAAKHLQPSPDSFRSLAHSREAPVTLAPSEDYVRLNAAAIVAHQHAKLAGRVLQFDLNPFGAGMAECIDNRFPPDPVKFIAQ